MARPYGLNLHYKDSRARDNGTLWAVKTIQLRSVAQDDTGCFHKSAQQLQA